MDHQKAAYQICAAQRDTLLVELEKVGKHPECTEAVWRAIVAAMNTAREAANAKEREIRAESESTPRHEGNRRVVHPPGQFGPPA